MLRRAALGLLAVLVLGLMLMAATPQGRTSYHTVLFITQQVPWIPTITLFQAKPERVRVTVTTSEGPREADLYRPQGDGPHAAMVLFLGVAPAGPDDPRVVDLGGGLARAGMATLVYWSPEKIQKRIHRPDIENLVAAYKYLQSQPFVDPDRVGYAGFCVGASFALMAAAHPEVRDDVAFVNAFGPYYDLRDVMRAVGTETRPSDVGPVPWEPDSLTREVTNRLFLESLTSDEVAQVRAALDLKEELVPTGLSQEAGAIFRILAGGTPEEVDRAMGMVPAQLLVSMIDMSPAQYLEGLRAPVLLMHDRADNLVPSDQSRKLAAALEGRVDVRLTEFSLFEHVDPTRPIGWWDRIGELRKLFAHLYGIMRQVQ